jgi:hypothetical protein
MIHRMLTGRILVQVVGVFVSLCLGGASAQAQDTSPLKPQFMSRYNFHISIAKLSSGDRRFDWNGRVGGDMDLVDYVKGRTSLFAEYEVVMGNELRPFDPNQGNYTFDGSSSWRFGGTEVAIVFHHLSRHLSDRPKTEAVAINSLEGRVLRHFELGETAFDARGGVGKVVQHAFLDYSWRGYGDLTARHSITPVVGWFGRTSIETFGVDPAIAGRNKSQTSGRLETGVRLQGKQGAVELFGGWENVADAYPVERTGRNWTFAGFRLVGGR